ncbi:hypothetical protein HY339_00830 [Candidatus Gottesmanbacteria bacterium]|nr:hypothetical protein [Candidatus Gottesmanbacteria bacterium]
MAKRLTGDQRGRVAEKIMEWGNLVFIGLVITQFVPGVRVNALIAATGFALIVIAYVFAVRFMKGGGR